MKKAWLDGEAVAEPHREEGSALGPVASSSAAFSTCLDVEKEAPGSEALALVALHTGAPGATQAAPDVTDAWPGAVFLFKRRPTVPDESTSAAEGGVNFLNVTQPP